MQRILIVGISGAGKSTLGRTLGHRYDLPVHHLDNIFHTVGWVARDKADVKADFDALAQQERWVVDGNYRALSTSLQERADTLIFLDYGTFFALSQVIRRWVLHHTGLQKRRDLGEGFAEQLPFSFLVWVWNWRRDSRPNWVTQLEPYAAKTKRFSSRRDLNRWLESLSCNAS